MRVPRTSLARAGFSAARGLRFYGFGLGTGVLIPTRQIDGWGYAAPAAGLETGALVALLVPVPGAGDDGVDGVVFGAPA
jgi:hypothetical protein